MISHGFILLYIWLNSLVYRWAGIPLLSAKGIDIAKRMPGQLIDYISPATAYAHGITLLAFILYLFLMRLFSHYLSRRFHGWFEQLLSVRLLSSLTLLSLVILLTTWPSMKALFRVTPTRYPFNVTWNNMTPHQVASENTISSSSFTKTEFESGSFIRDVPSTIAYFNDQHRLLSVKGQQISSDSIPSKTLIIIIESFRNELIDETTMPWLHNQATQGIYCSNHFSGGNSSQHGIFSLINGLNAYWYQQPVTYSPLLNRLYSQAGYKLGFFASKDDWREFLMDGFINAQHFDTFSSRKFSGIETDRQTLASATSFLEDRSGGLKRLAIAYLYSTHAPYHSYAEDQIFTPAADDRLIYPYRHNAWDSVWNKYRNSARSLDRLLSCLDLSDTNVLITGDHGESFLCDGTIGHGTKITRYQNMTPAILVGPNVQPRKILDPTCHADWLPTLLSISNLSITKPDTFDGVNLLQTTNKELQHRILATRDYLADQCILISPQSEDDDPQCVLVDFNLHEARFTFAGSFDLNEQKLIPTDTTGGVSLFSKWMEAKFPDPNTNPVIPPHLLRSGPTGIGSDNFRALSHFDD
ncbi:sulfatase-like hydrolase/transferase [Rubripirellula sp.]|nr:sulfatase-like hydrolase/transferase [Rubripirellula sp.]